MAGPTTTSPLNCYKPTGKRRVGAEQETTRRTREAEQRGQLTLALPPGLPQPRALSGLREEGGQRPSARQIPAEERGGPRGVPGPQGASCSRCCCPVVQGVADSLLIGCKMGGKGPGSERFGGGATTGTPQAAIL